MNKQKPATIADLKFDENNANKGTQRGRGLLEKSLQQYGAGRSVLIDKNNRIIAGNKTIETAGQVGMTKLRIIETDGNEIVAVKRIDLDLKKDRRARELAIADNRVGEVDLEWDSAVLEQLKTEGVDLESLGFSDIDLQKIGIENKDEITDAEPQIDMAAELNKKWKVKPGDLWMVGDHRLLCADSSKHENIVKIMGKERACCVFTDPPYGVSIGKKNVMLNSFQKAGMNLTNIVDDDLSPEELKAKIAPVFSEIKNTVMADDCTVFVCSPQGGGLGMMMMMMQESCHEARHVLIWKKNSPTFSMGRLDYDYQHEPILLTWGKKHKRPMLGNHRTSVWEIDKPLSNKEHPTIKPVELYINAFLNNSDNGDIVFDPYAGSGTCMVAAEQTGRKARGIEISKDYCAVILDRMQTAFPSIKIKKA
jgi:DNA modification methylase